jgi:hypothetical protein
MLAHAAPKVSLVAGGGQEVMDGSGKTDASCLASWQLGSTKEMDRGCGYDKKK